MAEIARLDDATDCIDVECVQRERTSKRAMEVGTHLHVTGLAPSNIVAILDELDVQRARIAGHDRVRTADLQPAPGAGPNHVALEETVVRIDDQQFWLYAVVDPETNDLLHIRLDSTCTTASTEVFPCERRERHDVDGATFLVDDAEWLITAITRHGLEFQA